MKKGLVFIISAPAGTGKTTLVKMLESEFSGLRRAVTCTTRPKRPGEIEGRDYHFFSKQAFEEQLSQNAFLEHATVFGNQYGTLAEPVIAERDKGHHVVLVIDTQGALALKQEGFEGVYIFLMPPSLAELRKRLFSRKTEKDEHIEERLEWAEKELQLASHYDYHITNDNLHTAFDALRSIVIAEEHKNREIKI